RPSRQTPTAPSTARRTRTPRPTRESLLWIIGPGEMFGELSIFDPGRRSTSAVAMLDCALYRISRDDLLRIVNDRHDVALAMLAQLASRLRRANDTTSGLVLSDVPGRLAYLLLSLASRFGTETPHGIEVHHDLTQAEIAQMVGASRETVNKALTDFVNRKWISLQAGSVLIKEPGRLRSRMD
ncbi:MAG TPA: Crp/Fnr family transcriptional regulator, partial [Propionibacteriaceae bacterium]|nr:Crp/Fnr family transcriptional regulator [Propionibacteriaceae bacterium]